MEDDGLNYGIVMKMMYIYGRLICYYFNHLLPAIHAGEITVS